MINIKYRYIKYSLTHSEIYNILNENKHINKIFIMIDLQGICRGFFKETNIDAEINEYVELNSNGVDIEKQIPNTLVNELKHFLNNLWKKYKEYNPFFIIFYDDGKNSQNTIISSSYKEGRSSFQKIIPDLEKRDIFKYLKTYWFKKIEEQFNKEGLSKVFYLKEYESDLIPYYCLQRNEFGCGLNNTLNIVLSPDKDLLQCCKFKNTYQIVNNWKINKTHGGSELCISMLDDYKALKYIDNTFSPGKLTSEYISLILSIAGDKSDCISGISGIGIKKAIKLIENNNIPCDIAGLRRIKNNLPVIIQENFDKIVKNYKLINFDEQISRTPILK